MTGPADPNPLGDDEEAYFSLEQLNTIQRFKRIKRFLKKKGGTTDKEVGEDIRTLP